MKKRLTLADVRLTAITFCLLAFAVLPSVSAAQGVPIFQIVPTTSSIKFDVEASVDIKGTFDKWDATLTFTSSDVTTGVAGIRIEAASVDTGNSIKNAKLKGKDFLDVNRNPLITFKSTKMVQSGPDAFELDGDFTMRGVTRSEKLTLAVAGKETGSATIKGTLYFNRKHYGMNSGIPFIKIADLVEVNVALMARRISGPPLVFKQWVQKASTRCKFVFHSEGPAPISAVAEAVPVVNRIPGSTRGHHGAPCGFCQPTSFRK